MRRSLAPLLLATCFCAASAAGQGLRVAGEGAWPRPKAQAPALRLMDLPAGLESRALLAPLAPGLLASAVDTVEEKRQRVGVRRDIAAEATALAGSLSAPRWTPMPGQGHVARFTLTSPQARSLRLGLVVRALPEGSELRVASGSGAAVDARAPTGVPGAEAAAATRGHGIYWTPLTAGDTQTVEIRLPEGADPATARVSLESASHLFAGPGTQFKFAGEGASQGCHEDVACVAPGNPAISRAARSVAKLVYTENGVSYLCTGTLINDGDRASQVPYLYTAAHCIGSQAAAATLNTFWFFEAPTCGAKSAAAYRQLTGGATLLHANPASDAALLRLAERAPEGTWFSGWDATPLAAGEPVISLHHPAGDLKKLATGSSLGFTPASGGAGYATTAWISGSTEGGSSGSGLFTLRDGEYVLRGGLKGGSASCSSSGRLDDPSNRDYYSRLEAEAATLRAWLEAPAAPLDDYTDMWWNPSEPGWGMSIIQRASNRVFVTWYTYDSAGRPTWLVVPDAAWKTATSLEGTIYRAGGSAFERPYDPARFAVTPVGHARIDFGSGDEATLAFTVDGFTLVKPIRRQAF